MGLERLHDYRITSNRDWKTIDYVNIPHSLVAPTRGAGGYINIIYIYIYIYDIIV